MTKGLRILRKIILSACAGLVLVPSGVSALSADQQSVFDKGIYFFNVDASSYCGVSPDQSGGIGGGGVGGTNVTAAQTAIAKTIIGIAKTSGLGQDAALVGLMVGLTESHLTNLANANVPISLSIPGNQGDENGAAHNYDSVGIFQQRVAAGWSTLAPAANADIEGSETASQAYANLHQDAVAQILNPAYAAEIFFSHLTKVSDWQSLPPWVAAQKVQGSAYADGSNYQKTLAAAQSLLSQNWENSDPVPLPVDLSISVSSGSGQSSSCFDSSSVASGTCQASAPVYGSVNGQGSEYSQDQLTKLFGDPGTASSHPQMDANLVTVNFLGFSTQVNKLVAPCLSAVAQEIQASGSTYKITQFGCYRFDSDNGTSNIGLRSYHTYGAACDINWDSNPFSESGAEAAHDMPEEYIKAFADHGFTWGGNWHQPKDFMHFEFNGLPPP